MTAKPRPLARLVHEMRLIFTNNWQIKILAGLVAFLFWHVVKSQISSPPPRSFTEKHSLRDSSGL